MIDQIMLCADHMNRQCPSCVPHQRLQDALEIMGEQKVSWVAVIESHADPTFLGWITARESAVFLGVFNRRPSEIMCREMISTPPEVLTPATPLDEAHATLARLCLKRMPVVEGGRLVGIFEAGRLVV